MIVSLKSYVTREGDDVGQRKRIATTNQVSNKVEFSAGVFNFRVFFKNSSRNSFDLKLSKMDSLNGLVIILLKG